MIGNIGHGGTVELTLTLTLLRWLLAACFALAMIHAMVCDLRTLQIPNWISAAAAALFLPAALLSGFGLQGLAVHYGTGLLIFAVGALLFWRGILGGGDVKLLACAAVWVGWHWLPAYLLAVSLIGGLLALVAFILKRFKHLPAFLQSLPWLAPAQGDGQPIPYAVAIGGAALLGFRHLAVLP